MAGVDLDLDPDFGGGGGGGGGAQPPWRQAALRAQLPAQLEQVRITRSGVCAPAMQACRLLCSRTLSLTMYYSLPVY